MKHFLLLGLAFSLLSSNSLHAETVSPGDKFRAYFDLTKSTSTLKRKAIFPTVYFANSNPLNKGSGWTHQVFDSFGNPLSSPQKFVAT